MYGFRKSSFAPVAILGVALAAAPTAAIAQPAVVGEWSNPPFDTVNVMIHLSVLPTGKVLFWGRREPGGPLNPDPTPDAHRDCQPRIWDPAIVPPGPGAIKPTANTPKFNMFCSSHTFLEDGRLFVAGGHIADSKGEPHATIYNPMNNQWSQPGEIPDMKGGRWYPTAATLPDGNVLVSFGTNEQGAPNRTSQVWKKDGTGWRELTGAPFDHAPYYPTLHVVSDGRAFMSGPVQLTQHLDTAGNGVWVPFANRDNNDAKDYGPSVLYTEAPGEVGKILYIGGGNPPTKEVEILDFSVPMPQWKSTDSMHFMRRHHNATLLPDGTILVMGGTQGAGAKILGEVLGFNDLTPGQPIRSAELWDPKKPAGEKWTVMAQAGVDRCYHSTAVLLPDATVLSAGGGEYSPKNDGNANLPEDSHRDAQIFAPPYLFLPNGTRAPRPVITHAPPDVKYGDQFPVVTAPDQVGKVTWIRLSSVTHTFNTNQRINFLDYKTDPTAAVPTIKVTAPANANLCPPGHYLLFVLSKTGVPSTASIVRIHP
jgi:galactose oxidase